jgi:nicotinate-nucleotide pyrophosphorylase
VVLNIELEYSKRFVEAFNVQMDLAMFENFAKKDIRDAMRDLVKQHVDELYGAQIKELVKESFNKAAIAELAKQRIDGIVDSIFERY